MRNDTTITIKGIAGTVPELKLADGERRWTRFRLACAHAYRRPDGQWVNEDSTWYTVRANGSLAEKAVGLVRKGTPLLVRGSLRWETWTDSDGRAQHGPALRADAIGVDVDGRGVVTYSPPQRSQPQPRDAEQEAAERGFDRLGPVPESLSGAEPVDVTGLPEVEEDDDGERADDGRGADDGAEPPF